MIVPDVLDVPTAYGMMLMFLVPAAPPPPASAGAVVNFTSAALVVAEPSAEPENAKVLWLVRLSEA